MSPSMPKRRTARRISHLNEQLPSRATTGWSCGNRAPGDLADVDRPLRHRPWGMLDNAERPSASLARGHPAVHFSRHTGAAEVHDSDLGRPDVHHRGVRNIRPGAGPPDRGDLGGHCPQFQCIASAAEDCRLNRECEELRKFPRIEAHHQTTVLNSGELLMPFDKIIAIDWSGAMDYLRDEKIQVAEYHSANNNHTVQLVGSRQDPQGRWSRADVFEYVQREVGTSRVLIGFDFAFAYPYCDRQAYFPGQQRPPASRQQLWETVEQHCNEINDFYGGPFFRGEESPFSEYFLYQTFRGQNYEERFRATDNAARRLPNLRLRPSTAFRCVGPDQVGTGSVAGMRFLNAVRQAANVPIWPFDVNGPPEGSTVVEIYPRLFLNQAQHQAGIGDNPGNIVALCAHFGANLQNPPHNPTGDQRDALVSAAAMGRLVRQGPNWQVPDCAATYEGWIFGV